MRKLTKTEQKAALQKIRERLATQAGAFPDCSDEAKQARREQGEQDFGWWCQTYLGHYFETALSPFHRELVELTEQRGVITVVAAPRGHGKSTLVTLARALWWLVYQRRQFIVLIGCAEDVALLMAEQLRIELEGNERLRCDFGDLTDPQGGCWSEGHFRTTTGVKVLSRGRGQKVRGIKNGSKRPDAVILDDPEDDEQAASPVRVRKLLAYVRRSVRPALQRGDQWSFFWVGTVLARRSALDLVLKNTDGEFSRWCTRLYQAITPDGLVLCPELHSRESLDKLKGEIGSAAFNAEMMNDPHDEEGPFRDEWLRTYRLADVGDELATGETVAACDPSLYAGESSDYKAILVVTRHPLTADLYVRGGWIRKASLGDMVRGMYAMHDQFGCVRVGLEQTMLTKLIHDELDAAAQECGRHLPVVPVVNSLQKEMRILTLSPLCERGKLHFPEGWPGDLQLLREQLQAFPSRSVHDDAPDALEMAVRLVGLLSHGYKSRVGPRTRQMHRSLR